MCLIWPGTSARPRAVTGLSYHARYRSILTLREDCRRQLAKQHHRALTLLDDLFINPYTTVARAADRLGVSPPTAQKTITQLEKAGILAEATGRACG